MGLELGEGTCLGPGLAVKGTGADHIICWGGWGVGGGLQKCFYDVIDDAKCLVDGAKLLIC